MHDPLPASVRARHGHFRLESGHHSDLWLDLEALCLRPRMIQTLTTALAMKLRPYALDAVCGPLNEGAFIALMVASALECEFTYAERLVNPDAEGLFPVEYKVPSTLWPVVAGKRIAIVNDVTGAGSAVRGTFADLQRAGAHVTVIASLVVFGGAIRAYAREQGGVAVESLQELQHNLWTPAECPLCARGMALDRQIAESATRSV